jgi:hypothetical protein
MGAQLVRFSLKIVGSDFTLLMINVGLEKRVGIPK